MDAILIALSMPVFFVLIGIDLVATRLQGKDSYRFHDAITDLSCGVGSLVTGAAAKLLGLGAYALVWEYGRFWEVSTSSVLGWVGVIVGVDFCYYWFHRAGHRMNLIWAGHAVHHQSEDYNLAVALRQSWYIPLVSWVFYIPLALLGFPPVMYLTSTTANTLYQFWIHTESVGRLGPLEWVLNTPSHHRAHHGVNPQYIDKNYAGIFIIWDRLFGTFEPEEDAVVYGTVKPVASWNPLWVNVVKWVEMFHLVRGARRLRDKLKLVFGPPEWRPEDLGGSVEVPDVKAGARPKYETTLPRIIDWYVGANFVLIAAGTSAFLMFEGQLAWPKTAALGVLLLVAVTSVGGLLELKRWAFALEATRLVLGVPIIAWLTWSTPWTMPASAAAAGLFGVMLVWLNRLPRAHPEARATGALNS
ncbi:sterol desaturase family protein [Persicimonas caeni]|uniref:Sterol desaturase family protein n=1 Tax=Persicimonas caeni TaxID=2292766 RepID=A0A4Y6PME4_PERCE|nr:sterol desaturase family protein [Persicimonas caeni]QDG49420.1 sterol desaturase family protein [Persicimonas caeni]QED30641.1 sterol desaturase family protein [Persicimonas caeni]